MVSYPHFWMNHAGGWAHSRKPGQAAFAQLLAGLALLASACGGEPALDQIRSDTSRSGDTLIVTTRGEGSRVRIDDVQVIWQSPELERPQVMLAVAGRLIVADPTRVHFLSEAGDQVRTAGREGSGPGEFRSITALGTAGRDTIVVHDPMLQRMSFLTVDGDHVGEVRVTPTVPFVNPVAGSRLVVIGKGALSFWEENIQGERPTRMAFVWRDLEADTISVIETWNGARWTRLGDLVVHDPLFGPQAIAAMSSDGAVAAGNGVDYCIAVRPLGASALRRICRSRRPVPVGAGIRRPDLSRVDSDNRREALAAIVRRQRVAEQLPSFDRLLFDDGGRLWVRTVGPELADVHPYFRRYIQDLLPAYRMWDVFDETGRFVRTVELPSTFTPQAITARRIYGFAELESGEIAIGAAEAPL